MFNDKISDYFEGVAAKYLSAVDTVKGTSTQHEIGGLVKAGFSQYLGSGSENFYYRVRQIYITDEQDDLSVCDGYVNWYDSRRNDNTRSPEYRLYYLSNTFTEIMNAGDFFLIAKLKNELPPLPQELISRDIQFREGSLLMICAPAGSLIENQLRTMFSLDDIGESLLLGKLDKLELLLPLRSLLEDLGVELGSGLDHEIDWLNELIKQFGGTSFPTTASFSAFARQTLGSGVPPLEDPDLALMSWMEREESLFRIYERHLVKERLSFGFGKDGEDVDAFIAFSLSVQNRRKSRVGHAFEGHLKFLFTQHKLHFEQGRGKKVTENNAKPDFIFPSFTAYHDPDFSPSKLVMLGAKTTCKDRWRQVLSEANRIQFKHLITLEPAISQTQTEEMRSQKLQLVIPSNIHITYSNNQQPYLMDVRSFIETIKQMQLQ